MDLYESADQKEKTAPKSITDIDTMIIDELASMSEKKLRILVYLNQAIMSFLIKSDFLKETLMNEFGNKALFDVILHKRNELLVQEIEKSNYSDIFITYGLLHFDGVFALLQKKDPRWRIENTEEYYPI
jgi:uncharacterized protein YbaP (TraB family)